VLTALRLYLREAVASLSDGASRVADALDRLALRERATLLPGYTHMQQAMPSSVPLWAGGFAAEIRDDAEGIRLAQRGLGRSRLGRGIRHARPAARSQAHRVEARLRREPGACDFRAALAWQGRSADPVRDRPADAGSRPLRRRRAALLHAGVRVRVAAGCVHDR